MDVLKTAARALPKVFAILGQTASFTLRGYEAGITAAASISGKRPRKLKVGPVIAVGYVTDDTVFLVANKVAIGETPIAEETVVGWLSDKSLTWTVQAYDQTPEINVNDRFRRFAPG